MKKNYRKIILMVAITFAMVVKTNAQLSGVYTINSAVLTGGSNFQSFTDFATAINGPLGVNGAVTVNVVAASGPYNQQVTLTQIVGMSAVNKVIINGNGNTLSFNSSSSTAPHTLLLNGTDNLTVNDLIVEAQGGTYAMACVLTNRANYNRFNGCVFKTPVNGTGTNHCPFSISGTATSPGSQGNGGDYNTVKSCTLANGYYSFTSYGPSAEPFQVGNSLIDSYVTDWYVYGPFALYNKDLTIKGCTFDRITRTASTTFYPTYFAYNQGALIEGNTFHKFFEAQPNATPTMYWYNYFRPVNSTTMGYPRNTWRNNIIKDMKFNGTLYMYFYSGAWDIYNNTFDWDYTGTQTGTLYHLYAYTGSGYDGPINIYNNIISMRKPGTGGKYAYYMGGTLTGINIDRNDVIMGTATSDYIGYTTAAVSTFTAWNTAGYDVSGFNVDPQYANQAAGDLHPTNAAINNTAIPMGLVFDRENQVRNPTAPDIGALEFLTPGCSGAPANLAVSGPTYAICPGEEVDLALGTLSAASGYTYQWQTSTLTAVGPWTNVNGATNISYNTPPITQPMWYNIVMTCTNGGAPGNASIPLIIAGTTTNSVPYWENFEGIGKNNRLPNCSWSTSNLGTVCRTFTNSSAGNLTPYTGASFASFKAATATNGDYFYTNGIQLEPGITYSASAWYITDGVTQWNDFSIWLGTNQSVGTLTNIASTSGNLVNTYYKSLSNTFTVGTSGLYYVAIRGRAANGVGNLSFDDVRIDAPCSLNSPVLAVTGPNQGCIGSSIILNASGANSYTWTGGVNTSSLNYLITGNASINLWGKSAASGCVTQTVIQISANLSPVVGIIAPNTTVCKGSSVLLTAYGANNYNWTTGAATASIVVSPTVTTTYTVIGVNAVGCSGVISQQITVKNLPVISAIASANQICAGETITLTATGATTFTWTSNNIFLVGSQVIVTPMTSTNYTVTGTDGSNCQATNNSAQIAVSTCLGLKEASVSNDGVQLFPNPNDGQFSLMFTNDGEKTIEVLDLAGRLIMSFESSDVKSDVNIKELSSGIYYVKVKSNNSVSVLKFVKQ